MEFTESSTSWSCLMAGQSAHVELGTKSYRPGMLIKMLPSWFFSSFLFLLIVVIFLESPTLFQVYCFFLVIGFIIVPRFQSYFGRTNEINYFNIELFMKTFISLNLRTCIHNFISLPEKNHETRLCTNWKVTKSHPTIK